MELKENTDLNKLNTLLLRLCFADKIEYRRKIVIMKKHLESIGWDVTLKQTKNENRKSKI